MWLWIVSAPGILVRDISADIRSPDCGCFGTCTFWPRWRSSTGSLGIKTSTVLKYPHARMSQSKCTKDVVVFIPTQFNTINLMSTCRNVPRTKISPSKHSTPAEPSTNWNVSCQNARHRNDTHCLYRFLDGKKTSRF